jgi:hypothetical protein
VIKFYNMTLLEENGKADEALKEYTAFAEDWRNATASVMPRYYLAALRAANGDEKGALDALEYGRQILLLRWELWDFEKGLWDKMLYLPRTLQILAACVKIAPDDGSIRCRVVEAYVAYGRTDKAFGYLRDNSALIEKACLSEYALSTCIVGAVNKPDKELASKILAYEETRASAQKASWPGILYFANLRSQVLKALLNAKDYAALADKADAELKQLEDDRENMKNLRADEEKRNRERAASSPRNECAADEYSRIMKYGESLDTMVSLEIEALGCKAIADVELGKKDGALDPLLGVLADISGRNIPIGYKEGLQVNNNLKLKCYSYLVTLSKLGQTDKADEFRKEAENLKTKK